MSGRNTRSSNNSQPKGNGNGKDSTKGGAKDKGRCHAAKGKRNADGIILDNGLPRSGKAPKFQSLADDNYCTNVNTLIGADKPPPEHDILLMALGLGPQL